MDNGSLFLTIVIGVAIGGYLREFLLYHTAHMWVKDEDEGET